MENPEMIDPKEELKQIRKTIHRRNIRLISISILLSLALVFGIVQIAIPKFESLYWDPYDSSVGSTDDLQMTLKAYTELFLPGWNFANVQHSRTGFAEYDLTITRYHVGKQEYDYQDGTLRKNDLSWGAGFTRDWVGVNLFDRLTENSHTMDEIEKSETLELLETLPQYITLEVAVSFSRDLTMEQIIEFHDSTNATVSWVGIRNCIPRESSILPCGMAPFTGVQVILAANTAYPQFYLDPKNDPDISYRAEVLEQHFESLLAYSAERLDAGWGARVFGGDRNYYREVLDYVGQNGILSYGCVVTGTPEQLLSLLDNPNVSQIKLMDGWIDLT